MLKKEFKYIILAFITLRPLENKSTLANLGRYTSKMRQISTLYDLGGLRMFFSIVLDMRIIKF